MKPIKSKAGLAWVREANQAKMNALDRLADVPGDTVDNSIDRLRLLIEDAKATIEGLERDRDIITAHRSGN
jgi:hypothetical protein